MLDLEKKLPFGIIIEICYLRGQVQFWTTHKLVIRLGNWFHWYESWSGGDPMFDNVGKVHEMYPDKNLLLLKVEKFDYLSCSVGQTGSVMENP
jgi:hypothetical protein